MEPRPQLTAPRDAYVYFPGNSPVPEWQAVNTKNRSFVIGALVDIPEPGAEGVLFAQGTRFGGHALYVKDNRLHYVNNFVGAEEQMVVATEDLPTGENLILSASFEKTGNEPICATGTLSLYHGDQKVGEAPDQDPARRVRDRRAPALRRPPGRRAASPTTIPGDAPYTFTGGTIHQVDDRRQRRAVRRPRAPRRDAAEAQ